MLLRGICGRNGVMKLHFQRTRTVYNYQDSKKIYFSNSDSKCCLFEKKVSSSINACQILKRNPIVTYGKNGVVVYVGKNR